MSHSVPIADELYERIKAYAASHAQLPDGLIEAWLTDAVRQAIDASAAEQAASEVLNDPLFKVAGIFAGNEPGWSKRHDELLAEQI
jgi:N-acetylglutamate synthase/N-acetylornithine aminotransferase